ncbi:hypothetical protein B0T10DRAFT_166404 [Thelonectria olida]|uniref:Uncharacterized protein n=1 Tax=Thelonectria olida TaxID=1576542 RepID=A0A9P9AV71_9HYPO|nr:hypothetical protein B0T10DRAFT_166404 [Thelonectria olida]
MASSNPFRKSSGPTMSPTGPPVSAAARFPSLDVLDTSTAPPEPSASDSKPKVTKQVRILSPPPLSPDSPDWPYTAPPLAIGLQQSRENDPFDPESPDDSDREIMLSGAPPPPKEGSRIPANPFSKTLRDIETRAADQKLTKERRDEGATLKVANTARRSLDVNSFKRLLMTGNLGVDPSSAQQTIPASQKTGADSSSISLSSSSYDGSKDGLAITRRAQEVSLISQDASDTPDDDLDHGSLSDSSASFQIGRGKKPPPPPSSRHGKSIKLELKSDSDATDILTVKSPSDMNKPLPPPPRMSFEDEAEPSFERQSTDGVTVTEAQFPSQNTPGSGKKPGPAPPPRRGHSRGESKVYPANNLKDGLQATRAHGDETPSRSSSIRSRTDRNRNDSHGPVPPPPPRRSHGSKPSTIISPEVITTINATPDQISTSPEPSAEPDRSPAHTELGPPRNIQTGTPKLAAPPPPPTRNASVRRPASVRSVDSTSRRTSAETKPHGGMAPPPPPRRNRGSSRGSMDGPYRRTSVDGVSKTEQTVVEEGNITVTHSDATSLQSAIKESPGVDILADLTALQREVDALRGKLGP